MTKKLYGFFVGSLVFFVMIFVFTLKAIEDLVADMDFNLDADDED